MEGVFVVGGTAGTEKPPYGVWQRHSGKCKRKGPLFDRLRYSAEELSAVSFVPAPDYHEVMLWVDPDGVAAVAWAQARKRQRLYRIDRGYMGSLAQ